MEQGRKNIFKTAPPVFNGRYPDDEVVGTTGPLFLRLWAPAPSTGSHKAPWGVTRRFMGSSKMGLEFG